MLLFYLISLTAVWFGISVPRHHLITFNVFRIRAKTNILNVNEQIIFLKNEYSNILYIISISLIVLNHKGTGRSS